MERRDCKSCGMTQYSAEPRFPQLCIRCRELVYPSKEEMRLWKARSDYINLHCQRCRRLWTIRDIPRGSSCPDCGGYLKYVGVTPAGDLVHE